MNKKKLWTMVLILAIVLALAIVWLIILNQPKSSSDNQAGQDKNANSELYTVTFYSNNGTILKIDSVEKGKAANPPATPQMLYGTVFQSWDAEISNVSKDLEVYPVCEDIKDKPNVFAVDGAYGKSGDTVIVPIRLCGEVCASAFDLTITYDSDALELLSVTEDGAVLFNDETPGVIKLNYVSTENTVADVDICLLEFFVKSADGKLPVTLEMHSIYACKDLLESKNDELYAPEYSILNGTLCVLPKGE